MTRAQRRTISNDFQRLQRQVERRYVAKIFNALKIQLNRAAEDVRVYGIEFAIRRAQVATLDPVMMRTIRDMHLFTGLLMARRTLADLKRHGAQKAAGLGFNEVWAQQIIEYFDLHLLESVTSIDETTRTYILFTLRRGFREGWSTEEMVRAINDRLYMKFRAERIVRTESTRATNYGITIGAEKYDFEVQKEWIAIRDNRTRHSHRGVDGELRDLDKPYTNGLMFPGDPTAPIKETANCRCTQSIVPKRDSRGHLIPKKKEPLVAA